MMSHADLELRPAIEFELKELADLLTRSFEKYFAPISFTPAGFATMLRLDGIDLNTSKVFCFRGKPAGCAMLAHRGWTTRLAAMGVTLDARGMGVGRQAMLLLIDEARARNDRAMVLEVIEQNKVAIRLYENCGFRSHRRLVGFRGVNPKGTPHSRLSEVDVRQVARVLSNSALDDLPWQASAGTLAQMGRPHCGFQLGPAFAVISDPAKPLIAIRSVAVESKANLHQGHGTKLLRALFARYPEKTWAVSVIWPEEIAPGFFESLGFSRESLTQYQMKLVF